MDQLCCFQFILLTIQAEHLSQLPPSKNLLLSLTDIYIHILTYVWYICGPYPSLHTERLFNGLRHRHVVSQHPSHTYFCEKRGFHRDMVLMGAPCSTEIRGFWGAPSWRCARLPNKFSYTTMECNCGRIFCTHRARQRQSIFRFPQSIHMQRVCYQSECLTHLPTQENETCFSWTNETDNPNNAQIYSFVLVQTIDHVQFLGLSYEKVISCELVRRGWPVFNRTTERGRGLVEIRVS